MLIQPLAVLQQMFSKRLLITCLLFVSIVGIDSSFPLRAADSLSAADDVELPDVLPGLIASFEGGQAAHRIDMIPRLHWDADRDGIAPDLRLNNDGQVEVRWSGLLQIKSAGEYRLSVMAVGKGSIQIDGRELLAFQSSEVRRHETASLPLESRSYNLVIQYKSPPRKAEFGLYWQGSDFRLEPLSERFLSHRTQDHPGDQFERGRLLSQALNCTACHRLNQDGREPNRSANATVDAPSLTRVAMNVKTDWLIERLMSRGGQAAEASRPAMMMAVAAEDDISRRMPHFAMTQDDARAVAAALFQASRTSLDTEKKSADAKPTKTDAAKKPDSGQDKPKNKKKERTEPDAAEGKRLIAARGCVACHAISLLGIGTIDDEDESNWLPHRRLDNLRKNLYSGGDLSLVGDKRPAGFTAAWLADPAARIANHRMPKFELSDLERRDVELFLQAGSEQSSFQEPSESDLKRGRTLIAKWRCGACHELPTGLKVDEPRDVKHKSAAELKQIAKTHDSMHSVWGDKSCLTSAQFDKNVPGFALDQKAVSALQLYWQTTADVAAPMTPAELIGVNNCLNCHARGTSPGLAQSLSQVIKAVPELAPQSAAVLPPSLNSVGDKLQDAALRIAIERKEEARRPWLEVRMPVFPFDGHSIQRLADQWITEDRLPPSSNESRSLGAAEDNVAERLAAGRLVTSDGFGCQSCHQIGKQLPPTVALNARGTDLTMLGNRIRREWFERWVRNPVRIVPRMEMPAIQVPVHGVLGDDLNRQLDAVWRTLNTPGFQPPTPAPVRVVRGHNQPGLPEHANVLTDVLETPDRKFLRPMIVGLGNRHNVLLDLESGEFTQWWIGDTARELTRGKSWYWEPGAPSLNAPGERLLGFALRKNDKKLFKAAPIEQFAVEFDGLEHTTTGVRIFGRMHFGEDPDIRRTVKLRVEFEELDRHAQTSGAQIQLVFEGLSQGESIAAVDRNGSWIEETQSPISVRVDDKSELQITRNTKDGSDRNTISFQLITVRTVDQFALETVTPDEKGDPAKKQLPTKIAVVPGFEGTQYPLPRTEMPTALAWRENQLLIGSLKGRVAAAIDTDSDGLPDQWQVLSDDLPAPYGLAVRDQAIDVLCKFGLIRLTPPANGANSKSNTAQLSVPYSMRVVADGWGYTADYHDWAVGLPIDAAGNYYVALPCQQDDRSQSAARLRGTVQKLIPQAPTSDDPREYRLETMSAGQRFPMGLAFNAKGDLFATDNQGNYNPFNELNHLVAGRRYGFINKLDAKPGFSPPFDSPAVNLPHPWTRSVNGICCLITPDALKKERGDVFGPFEGHLIGCEYNGLSLIRMSLEKIDGEYQGAAYMFSRPPREGEPTFEGPVVCSVSPSGEVVVGNIHDSGWGGGQNTGSIVSLRPTGAWQLGIRTVTAATDGLKIEFTGPVDRSAAIDPKNYSIRSYRRVSTPAYGGDDQDEKTETIQDIKQTDDASAVRIRLGALREGCVYEVRVSAIGPNSDSLFPSEAHYNMKRVPKS